MGQNIFLHWTNLGDAYHIPHALIFATNNGVNGRFKLPRHYGMHHLCSL